MEEVLRSARPRSVRYSAAYLALLALAILMIALLVPSPTSSPPPLHTDDETKTQSASYIEGAACARPAHLELDPLSGETICVP